MKLSNVFNLKNGLLAGLGLLAGAAVSTLAPQDQAKTGNLYDGTKFGWDTMTAGESYKTTTAKARDILIQADPVFKKMISDTALVFSEPRGEQDRRFAIFGMAEHNTHYIQLYKNDAMYDGTYALFSRVHADEKNPPTKDDLKTAITVLNIANETAHYLQSKNAPDFMAALFKDGVSCSDKMAPEHASDVFMVSTAVKAYNVLKGSDENTQRLKTAITWGMESLLFNNFSAYIKDPNHPESQKMLEDFLNHRQAFTYKNDVCDGKDRTPISEGAKKALTPLR